jgi:hypothetical protein
VSLLWALLESTYTHLAESKRKRKTQCVVSKEIAMQHFASIQFHVMQERFKPKLCFTCCLWLGVSSFPEPVLGNRSKAKRKNPSFPHKRSKKYPSRQSVPALLADRMCMQLPSVKSHLISSPHKTNIPSRPFQLKKEHTRSHARALFALYHGE